jgi:hypothetical protein
MKKLVFVLFGSLIFVSCKTTQTVSDLDTQPKLDRNGFEVVYIGYNPQDSLYEKYPVTQTDSLEYHYDLNSQQYRIYVVEETRYVVLNENYELLWIESK